MTASLYGICTEDGMPTFYALMLDQYFENELEALTGMRYEARRSVDYGKHYDGMLLCIKGCRVATRRDGDFNDRHPTQTMVLKGEI